MSEIAFAFVLDLVFLGEPTNGLATLGTSLVFCSVLTLACAKARGGGRRQPTQPLTQADAAREHAVPSLCLELAEEQEQEQERRDDVDDDR